jgi:hypothetical protein
MKGLRDRTDEGTDFGAQRVEKQNHVQDCAVWAQEPKSLDGRQSVGIISSSRASPAEAVIPGEKWATAVASGLLPESVFGSFSRCSQVRKLLSKSQLPGESFWIRIRKKYKLLEAFGRPEGTFRNLLKAFPKHGRVRRGFKSERARPGKPILRACRREWRFGPSWRAHWPGKRPATL